MNFGSEVGLFVDAPTSDVRGGTSGLRNDKVGEDARGQRRCESRGTLVSSDRKEGGLWFPFWIDAKFWEVVEKSLCVVNGSSSASWDTQ